MHETDLCQGDCDGDSDCSGDLICFQRRRFETVPGMSCSATGVPDVFGFWDQLDDWLASPSLPFWLTDWTFTNRLPWRRKRLERHRLLHSATRCLGSNNNANDEHSDADSYPDTKSRYCANVAVGAETSDAYWKRYDCFVRSGTALAQEDGVDDLTCLS